MEGLSAAAALKETTAILVPVAMAGARWCIARHMVRNPRNIRKSLILIPRKAGKTMLAEALARDQAGHLIVDVDEMAKMICPPELLEKAEAAKAAHNAFLATHYSTEAANRVLEEVRRILVARPGTRAIFLSSNPEFAGAWRRIDGVFYALPSDDLHKETLARLDSEVAAGTLSPAPASTPALPATGGRTWGSNSSVSPHGRTRCDTSGGRRKTANAT